MAARHTTARSRRSATASDYDSWALPLWRTDELRPTFAAVLERMRVRTYAREEAGPFHARCLDAAGQAGWPVDAATFAGDLCDLDAGDGFGLETVNVVDGVRWNTAFAYLDPVRSSDQASDPRPRRWSTGWRSKRRTSSSTLCRGTHRSG